jgi:hypothetical protein
MNHQFVVPASSSSSSSSHATTGTARKARHTTGSKRDAVAKMAVAPSLKPYLALPGVGSVQAGLYKFLSPVVVDGRPVSELTSELVAHAAAHATAHAAAHATAEAAAAAAAAAETALEEQPLACAQPAEADRRSVPHECEGPAASAPAWYAQGDGVAALLTQSEALDWAADSGGDALPLSGKVAKAAKAGKAKAAKAAKDASARDAAAAQQAAREADAAEAEAEAALLKQRGGKRGAGARAGKGGTAAGAGPNKSRKLKGASPPSVAVSFVPLATSLGPMPDEEFSQHGGMGLSRSSLVSELCPTPPSDVCAAKSQL